MPNYTRADFLKRSGAAATALGLGGLPGCTPAGPPNGPAPGGSSGRGGEGADLVLLNGRVYTVDDALPWAEAFAVRGGRFVAVGSTDQIRNLVGPGTEVIDAEGMTVTPGFIDAHSHLA